MAAPVPQPLSRPVETAPVGPNVAPLAAAPLPPAPSGKSSVAPLIIAVFIILALVTGAILYFFLLA